MKKVAVLIPISLALALSFQSFQGPKEEEWVNLSRPFVVDKKYPAMTGPLQNAVNQQLSVRENELIWLTGFSTEVVGLDLSRKPDELVCHAAVWQECFPKDLRALWGTEGYGSGRFFTLAQGQTSLQLPEGFGLPIPAAQTFMLGTQLLNEWEENKGDRVHHRAKINFVYQSELKEPMKPLVLFEVTSRVYLDPKVSAQKGVTHAEVVSVEGGDGVDSDGTPWNAHWLVPKGRHEYVNPVDLDLPFDTTVHYIAIHLHRFAVKCDLVDKTTGEVIFSAHAHHKNGRLVEVEQFSSEEGKPLFKDHQYEIRAVYDNPEDEPQGAMAIAFLYVADKNFKMPDLSKLEPVPPIIGEMKEMFCSSPELEFESSNMMNYTGKGLKDIPDVRDQPLKN